MADELMGAIGQVLVFTLIPFLVFLFQKKTYRGFWEYVGLKRSTRKANAYAVLASLAFSAPTLILVSTSEEMFSIMTEPTSITGKFRAMEFGWEPLLLIFVIACFKTALAEEILFRGFVAKRFITLWGFAKGNIAQALLFGLIHAGLFAMITTHIGFLFLIFLLPSAGAYVSGYLNERLANGSIVPGWISHALANVTSYSVVGFL